MDVENAQDSNLEYFKKTLEGLIPKLNEEIDKLNEEAMSDVFLSGDSKMNDMLKKLDDIEGRLKSKEETSLKYQNWQEVLQTNQSTFENLDKLREEFNIRAAMWRSLKEWEELTAKWVKTQFSQIDAPSIEKEAIKFAKISSRVEKGLPSNPIATKLKDLVDTFKGTMPVVVALRCPDLKENHWKEIMDKL